MQKKELVIPFYCFSCGNLTFVHQQKDREQVQIIDYRSPNWVSHACFNIHQETFTSNPHIQHLHSMEWGSNRMPFVHRQLLNSRKQRKFELGIVLLIPPGSTKNGYFSVLTPENSVIEIKTVQKKLPESCGLLIDLSDMVRIGKGKYRQEKIKHYDISDHLQSSTMTLNDVYQVKVSSVDQEQLETFVNRLLKAFLSRKIAPLNIVPLKITKAKKNFMHHRQITIPPDSDLYATLEKTNVPEFIHLSVKQFKIPEVKSKDLIDV